MKFSNISKILGIMALLLFMTGCGGGKHPKDKTNLDDIIHCGFGKEYVSGYTKSNGRKVDGYCRNSN